MNRLPVFWVQRPDEDSDDPAETTRSISFRVTEDWLSTDADQLILPIRLLERNGEEVNGGDGHAGLLKQYGGERLLNDLLMDEEALESGSHWVIEYSADLGFHAYSVPDLEDD